MSPDRRHTYHAPRDRREVVIAVAASAAIVVFTAVMIWILGPHDSGTSSTPTITAPISTTTTKPAKPKPSSSTTSTRPTSSTTQGR
jgi:hypothetical protein